MDRQHWINLAYKLCFWEEEQVHGSQINQINKVWQDYQCTTRFLYKLRRRKKYPKQEKQNKTKTKHIYPFVPCLESLKWSLNCNNKMFIFSFLSHVKHLKQL